MKSAVLKNRDYKGNTIYGVSIHTDSGQFIRTEFFWVCDGVKVYRSDITDIKISIDLYENRQITKN